MGSQGLVRHPGDKKGQDFCPDLCVYISTTVQPDGIPDVPDGYVTPAAL